jgi:hypothetical protein
MNESSLKCDASMVFMILSSLGLEFFVLFPTAHSYITDGDAETLDK